MLLSKPMVAHQYFFIWAMVWFEANFCIGVSEKFHTFSSTNRQTNGFKYEVNVPKTGDKKHHSEIYAKDQVFGSYSIIDPNGAHRYVEYVANSKGFNAIVRQKYRSPGIHKHRANLNEFYRADASTTPTTTSATLSEIPIAAIIGGHSYRHCLRMDEFIHRKPNQVESFEGRRIEFEKLLQNREYIQSLPKESFTLDYLQPKQSQQTESSQTNERNIRNRQQQYKVTEPELDFIDEVDIRR